MAAGSRFDVSIVAIDRFTKTFRNLNNQASKAARPLVNIHRQVGALAKELHLDKAAKGIGKVSEAATTLTRTLGLSLGPLDAVLGASGIVGGLLAAGVGAIGLGVRFASTGFEISRTSQRLGVSTSELQRYRGAARLAGVDQDAMTGAIANLGDTLQDAKFGRNPVALQMLNKFGLAIHTNRDGTIDAITTMRELSGVLQGVADPHVQSIIARAFGMEDALPVLRQGPQAVEALAKEAERLGLVAGPQALKWADDFTASLNHMKGAIDGAANALGAKMLPSLTRVIDAIAKGIDTGGLRGGVAKLLQGVPGIPPIRLLGQVLGIGTGPDPTTPAQRSVSGQIGGPLQQGPYVAPGAGKAPSYAMSPAAQNGGLIDGRYVDPAVQAERDRVALSVVQSELANAANTDDRAALTRELAARQAGAASGTLTPQKVQVDVAFRNAPPGTTATARSTTENAFVPTRIAYSFPGDGP